MSAGFVRLPTSLKPTRPDNERVHLDPLRKAETPLVRSRRRDPGRPRTDMGCGVSTIPGDVVLAPRALSYPGSTGFRDCRDLEISERGGRVRTLVRADGCGIRRTQCVREQHRPCDRRFALMTPLLEARAISRRFGHVRALDGADFAVHAGEICALIGDNGADRAAEAMNLSPSKPVTFNSPNDAQAQGIATVYQDLALAADLPPFENLFLGRATVLPCFLGELGF